MEAQSLLYFTSLAFLVNQLLNHREREYSSLKHGALSFVFNDGKAPSHPKKNEMLYRFDEHNPVIRSLTSARKEEYVKETLSETLTILSYFATSLFTKNSIETVFWDIVKNCISQLGLEDCVLYHVEHGKLVQKAAFGHKGNGAEQKVLTPITLAIGEGIVGTVARTGKYELVGDTSLDHRYIVDDMSRSSELAVPIIIDKRVIGVLDSENSQPNFFKANHLFMFQLICGLIEKKLQQIYQKKVHIKDDNIYYQELQQLFEHSKIYRDNALSLDTVAARLKISSNYLSQIINRLRSCNFSDYTNSFRVNDVKKKMGDQAFSQYTIVSMALEAGFNSKSAFYQAFKKHTGMSPKQFKAEMAEKS